MAIKLQDELNNMIYKLLLKTSFHFEGSSEVGEIIIQTDYLLQYEYPSIEILLLDLFVKYRQVKFQYATQPKY